MTRKDISGKSGRIIELLDDPRVKIKLDSGSVVELPVSMLKAPRKFSSLSSSEMRNILDKPYNGYKKGQRVTVSQEGAVYADV